MATFSETFDMRDLSVATDRGKGQSEGAKISVQSSLCSVSVICLDLLSWVALHLKMTITKIMITVLNRSSIYY